MFFSVLEIEAIAGRVQGRNHFSIFSVSTSHHGADRGGGAPECDAVDVEEVTDAAPAPAEAEVAAFPVHDFQHTDIMGRHDFLLPFENLLAPFGHLGRAFVDPGTTPGPFGARYAKSCRKVTNLPNFGCPWGPQFETNLVLFMIF